MDDPRSATSSAHPTGTAWRDWVITGRERHVAGARDGNLPYPMRGLRTKDFLYIRNFAPDRWPMGNPRAVAIVDPSFTGESGAAAAAVQNLAEVRCALILAKASWTAAAAAPLFGLDKMAARRYVRALV